MKGSFGGLGELRFTNLYDIVCSFSEKLMYREWECIWRFVEL